MGPLSTFALEIQRGDDREPSRVAVCVMSTQDHCRAVRVPLGPNGEVLTTNNLPSPRLKRWSAHRKAEVGLGGNAAS